jgi:hypothetical protein
MKMCLLIVSFCLIQTKFIEGKTHPHKDEYISAGFLDHKTGMSLIGYARTLKTVDRHEFFVGGGTLIAAITLAIGWKYYLHDSQIPLYSVVAFHGVSGMGGEFGAPFISLGAEKSITEKLYINAGLNTTIRMYNNRSPELISFPNINLNWRY